MTEPNLDRIARLLSGSRSRRQALATLGALAAARLHPAHGASQLEIAACGEEGAVCTPVKGCCSGLACVTSTMNPAYGVCVPGEGDILAVSDDLVVPGSEGVTDELAEDVTDAEAAAAEGQAILDERATAIQTRKDERRARVQAQRTKRRTRKSSNRLSSLDDNKSLDRKPRLTLTLSETTAGIETLHVVNNNDTSVLLSRIESLTPPHDFKDFTITIGPGGTHTLRSDTDEWPDADICSAGAAGDGVSLTVTKFGATRSHQLEALCDPPPPAGSTTAARSQSEKKTPKKPRGQKHSKRGKGQ